MQYGYSLTEECKLFVSFGVKQKINHELLPYDEWSITELICNFWWMLASSEYLSGKNAKYNLLKKSTKWILIWGMEGSSDVAAIEL